MSQHTTQIGSGKTGLDYRNEDNAGKLALQEHNKGATAPAYATAGTMWIDDSGSPLLLKIYDGADWITIAEIDATADTILPYVGAAAMRLLNHAADITNTDNYEIAPVPAPTAYTLGMMGTFTVTNGTAGPATIDISTLGPKDLYKMDGSQVDSGDLLAGIVYLYVYDGTNVLVLNSGGGSGAQLAVGTTTNSTNDYSVTTTPPFGALSAGMTLVLNMNTAPTGSSTINPNGIGATNCKDNLGNNIASGAWRAGQVVAWTYDGTNFILVTPPQKFTVLPYAADSGSANAYAIAPTPPLVAYAAGVIATLKPGNANTGASTLNVSSLGTKNIKLSDGSDPPAGAMIATGMYFLEYDGTNFVLQNPEIVARINNQTGTSYSIQLSDMGKVVVLDNSSAIGVTIPNSLPAGFYCTCVQKNTGQVSFTATASGALRNRSSFTKIAGRYGMVSLFVESNAGTAPEIYIGGDGAT